MEAYSNAHHVYTRTSHLTKLYNDTKKSALISLEVTPTQTQQFSSLHLKYRIQKDRLITWGLAWSDDEKGPDGNIDESVARAGLTETVDSVLRNIKEVTDEAERIKAATATGILSKGGDSKLMQPVPFDEARYEDLLRDLTTSIDTLYDLSRSRKALARGEHPTFNKAPEEVIAFPDDKQYGPSRGSSIKKGIFDWPSEATSQLTLVNPGPFLRPNLSPYFGLPPRIEQAALRLPEEGPPPYEALGVPSATRLVGTLVRVRAPTLVQNAIDSSAPEVPILVDFANFDLTYRDTGVPPPLQRLEALASFLQPMRTESQTNLSLLGYFEDTLEPRIGLVYDLPYSIQNRLQGTFESDAQKLAPISLLKLLQKASKTPSSGSDAVVPPLEDRFRIALSLTQQLQALHTHELPHGNINSSSVIFATTENETPESRQKQIRAPLWASFDLFSKCSTEGIGRKFNLNIYRHHHDNPLSQDRTIENDIKFDLYSLAVLLLEIGLWTPIGELYKAKYTLADFKLRLEKLWAPKLAAKCGSTYMSAVQVCLKAADGGLSTPDATYDFVLRNLHKCCHLDSEVSVDPAFNPFAPSPFASEAQFSPLERLRRKRVPETAPFSRQMSADSPDLMRTMSFSTAASSPQSRLSAVPNLPMKGSMASDLPAPQRAAPSPRPLARNQPSDQNTQLGRRGSFSNYFNVAPSFKDYKRKITLIQKKWREYRERSHGDANRARDIKANTPVASEAVAETRNRPKRKEFPSLDLPRAVVDDWHNNTSIRLAKLVERALKGSPESSSIALTAFGETIESARPTYLVCCSSTSRVKQILKRHFLFDSETCDVRVRKDEIRRCRRSRRVGRSAEARRSMALSDGDVYGNAANPDYQERPLCGASIGAFRDDDHLPPVSFGGIVLVDGLPYGMSVHHMLEAEEEEEEVPVEPELDDDSDTSSIRSFDNLSIHSESDDESTVRPPSTIEDIGISADVHDGDCPGIVPGDFEEVSITQPALDDALDMDLHVDEEEDDEDSGIDEDHLLSYKLGQVHASSGLKRSPTSLEGGFRSMSQSLPQEIDWALLELLPPRVHPFNVVRGGRKYCVATSGSSRDTYPNAIRTSANLACTKVHCLGRTSGLASGVISSTMELVKIHGRSTFSASWTVDGNFGVGGDSGAWVISNDDGTVCGHVLASRRGRTYICPMDLLLDDIKQTLGASKVSLPSRGSSGRSGRAARDGGSALADDLRRLRVAEGDTGGVALPSSSARFKCKTAGQVQAAAG